MASDPRKHRRQRACLLTQGALLLGLTGCRLLAPEVLGADDCPLDGRHPLGAAFDSSEGTLEFDEAQLILTSTTTSGCYGGISLTFGDSSQPEVSCWLRISGDPSGRDLGVAWPIDEIVLSGGEECTLLPTPVRAGYVWDRISEGGYVKVIGPEALASQLEDSCLREGIEVRLNARMIIDGVKENPNAVKEFWFTENTYFIDEPLPVVEAFDCPF